MKFNDYLRLTGCGGFPCWLGEFTGATFGDAKITSKHVNAYNVHFKGPIPTSDLEYKDTKFCYA